MADSVRGTVAAAKGAVAASETLMRILLLGQTLWDQKSGESPDVPVGQELNLFQRSLEDNIQVLNGKTVGLGNSAVWALEGLQGDLKEAAKEAHKILGKGFFESIWDANRSYAEVKLLKEKALTPYQVALLFVALTVELENKDKQDEFQGGLARLQSLLRAQTIFNASAIKSVVKAELQGLWRPVYSEIRQSQPHKIDEGIFFIKATELQTDDVKTFFGDVLAELEDEKERRAPPPPPPAATAPAPSGAASSAGGRSSRKKVPATDTLKWYHDPITWELMCDPVKASDGRTYDRWTFIDHGSSMKRSPFDRREDRPLKIEFDDIDVRSRLFYKFPEQETEFRRRRNEFRQKALQLASAGSAESLPLLDHVLLWAVDDAECQAKKADILSRFPGLEAGAIDNLKDVFATFDSDGDGSISLDELGVAYRMLGYDLSPQLLREMVRIADIDGDGSIDFSEFLGMILEQQNSSRLRSAQRTPPLTAEQVARYRDAFSSFDIDGDGTITVQELGTAMRLLGHNLSEAELRAMVRSADRDGSGTLDFGEFITFITRDQPQQQQQQQPGSVSVNLSQDQVLQYTNTFLIMDGDGDGGIDARELASAMRLLGKPLTVAEAQSLINEYDLDGSGTLNLVEYLLMMSGHHSQEEEPAAAAGAAPLRQFTQEELARYREVFESFDSNGDGKITLTEMYRALQLLQRGVPLDTLESIFRWLDKDNSGALEWPEFIRWLSESEDSAEATREEEQEVQHPAFSQEQVSRYRGLFNELDRDGDGRVDAQELRTLFLRAGETVTEEEVREFIQRLSPDGRFNFAQFLEAMAKGSQLDEQERAQPPQRQSSSNRGPPPSQQPQWQHSSSRSAPPQRQPSSGRVAPPPQPQRQPSSGRVAPPPPAQQPQRQQSSSRPPPALASSRISPAELTQMQAKFRLFDRDGDGRISIHELGTVLRLLGESPTQADLEAMIGAGDTDGSGTLDFEEFLQLMSLRS